RRQPGAIDLARSHEGSLRIWFHTRSGLEDVLKEELGREFGRSRFVAPGIIEAELSGPLSRAAAIRTALHVGFPLVELPRGTDLAEDIVRALSAPASLAIFRAFTSAGGPIRFRIAFVQGGHRRAVVWRCAELIRAETRELVNDPKESTWEVVVSEV